MIAARSYLSSSFMSPLEAVLEMLLVLEEGLRWSPTNTQFKLLLILMYNALGAAETSFSVGSADRDRVSVANGLHSPGNELQTPVLCTNRLPLFFPPS